MSTNAQPQPTYIIPPPATPNWKTPLLLVVILLLIASNIYLYVQVQQVRTDNRNQLAKLSTEINGTIEKMQIDSSAAVQNSRRTVTALQDQLRAERRAASREVGQAKIDAENRVSQLQSQVSQAQAQQAAAISAVKEAADTANTKIASVSTDVQANKTQLDQTIANLKRVVGDVDNHASLIATNGKELDALRQLGERNYAQFTIHKSKTPQRVGDVMIELKKADTKHNRFTLNVIADDKTVEKKDRTINEPIQFYTSKAKQPEEIVVNSVTKNTITGYLSMPKVQTGRS
jgi:chromosome segregation ATPase